ncbi:hypothetical protein HG531_002538 [Fusarium graminearum]|nr:hypothetical protein HG531_002538 [Fusarium graminearum]
MPNFASSLLLFPPLDGYLGHLLENEQAVGFLAHKGATFSAGTISPLECAEMRSHDYAASHHALTADLYILCLPALRGFGFKADLGGVARPIAHDPDFRAGRMETYSASSMSPVGETLKV